MHSAAFLASTENELIQRWKLISLESRCVLSVHLCNRLKLPAPLWTQRGMYLLQRSLRVAEKPMG